MRTKEEIREYNKEYRQKNKKKIKEYLQRPEIKKRKREQARVYRKNNLEKLRGWWKEYRKKNKDKRRKSKRKFYEKNKEKNRDKERKRAREFRKNYPEKVRGYYNNYTKKKRKIDKNYNVRNRLRCLFCATLRYYTKTGKIKKSDEYEINYKEIIEHLKPFPEDISLYHIDHIKPLCSFDLTNSEEIKKAFAPENHQWLLARDNLVKGGKY